MTLPYGMVVPQSPTKPTPEGASGVSSQRDRRFTDTFFDIHKSPRFPRGRPWCGEREYAATPEMGHQPGFISADLQCGEAVFNDQGKIDRLASLASAWSAPWLPMAKYFRFNYQRKLITFDYTRGIRDERESLDRYFAAAAKLAGANGWGEIRYGVMPNYQITAILGEPTPYLPVYQAAQAGDPWLLGHIDEPNEKLAKILGMDQAGYVLSARRVEVPAVVPVEKVLATPPQDLAQMIAAAVAQALAAERIAEKKAEAEKSAENKRRMAARRAKRKTPAQAESVPA